MIVEIFRGISGGGRLRDIVVGSVEGRHRYVWNVGGVWGAVGDYLGGGGL